MYVTLVELIAAFGAEFRRILGIFRLPAALVATVQGLSHWLLGTTLGAELTLIDTAAGTGPAKHLRVAAIGAELAGVHRATFTGPTGGGRGL